MKKHIAKIYLIIVVCSYFWGCSFVENNMTSLKETAYSIINAFTVFNITIGTLWVILEIKLNKK